MMATKIMKNTGCPNLEASGESCSVFLPSEHIIDEYNFQKIC